MESAAKIAGLVCDFLCHRGCFPTGQKFSEISRVGQQKMRVEFGSDESIPILENTPFCIVIEPIFAPKMTQKSLFLKFL